MAKKRHNFANIVSFGEFNIVFGSFVHIMTESTELPARLKNSIPSLSLKKADAVVNLIRAESTDVGEARTTSRTVLPPNSRCRIKCHTDFRTTEPRQSVLFSSNILDSELEFVESVGVVK